MNTKYIDFCFILPPVLSKEEQTELLNKLPNEEARKKLIEHNLRLVKKATKKFWNTNNDINDLMSIGTIGLSKAVDNYDIKKNVSFSTFAYRCISNEIIIYIRETICYKMNTISINELMCDDENKREDYIQTIFKDMKHSYKFDEKVINNETALLRLNYFSNKYLRESLRKFLIFLYMIGEEKQIHASKKLGIVQSTYRKSCETISKELKENVKTSKLNDLDYLDIRFSLKDENLYISISKQIVYIDKEKCFPFKEESYKTYYLIFPFEIESFIEIADIMNQYVKY